MAGAGLISGSSDVAGYQGGAFIKGIQARVGALPYRNELFDPASGSPVGYEE